MVSWSHRDMNLKQYIAEMGDAAFAKKHKVTERCARSWRLGDRRPTSTKGQDIAKRSGGKLNFQDVYAA